MQSSRWKQVEELYHAALEREAGERASFLEQANPELRREVESLLAQDSDDGPFDRPAFVGAASLLRSTVRIMTPGTQLGPYKIEGSLGAGGMGEVFHAIDSRLMRSVAIKVIQTDRMSDPEHKRRFLHEARAASALNHPNIVALYDIANHGEIDFLVMEFVQGRTLKDLITGDGLPFPRVLEYGVQVASALAAAHKAGIVHRDVKPANVMVTADHQVKLLDFGIAKLTRFIGPGGETEAQAPFQGTVPGVAIGTVAYMSPEQTRGDPVEARSDIFSLGCLLYQAATGRLPFNGVSVLAIMHEIATVHPSPPSRLRPEVPAAFDTLIAACLEKLPNGRPATAGEVEQRLRSLLQPQEVVQRRAPEGRRSVAVLPLKLRTQEGEFLSAALADAIVTRLASTGKLLVRPTASVMRYAGTDTEWTHAAREMNVDLVVEGNIQKIGEKIRVLVQAHQVAGTITAYAAKHDGDMGDLFGLQDRIADGVCDALVPQRSGKKARPASPPTESTPAYELYMRAADRMARLNKGDTQTAIELLTHATTLDPKFSDAWGRLAQACIQMGVIFDSDARWLGMAEDAIAKTLALDAFHADAFCAQGQLLWTPLHGYQNQPALRALNAALNRNPGCHQAQVWRGLIQFHLGLYTEARLGLEEALAVNPEDSRALVFLAHNALFQGDYEEAYELDKRALAIDPAGVWQNLFFPIVPIYLRRPGEAIEALRAARQMVPEEATLTGIEGLIAATEGEFQRAEKLADMALESKKTLLHTHHLWHYAASVYALCGKPDKAIPWLRKCADMGLPNYRLFSSDPYLRGLDGRPEFVALMSELRRTEEIHRKEFGVGL